MQNPPTLYEHHTTGCVFKMATLRLNTGFLTATEE